MIRLMLLISSWSNEYTTDILRGVDEATRGKDIGVDVFIAYDIINNKHFYDLEKEVFSLPNPIYYDGVIVALSSHGALKGATSVVQKAQALGKKIITVDCKINGIPFMGIDNYKSEYMMVEHLIKHHAIKDFAFVGGIEDHPENVQRFRGFKECLRDNNIEVDPDTVKHYHFLYDDGRMAYEHLRGLNKHKNRAIIVANDQMALGYMSAASDDGLVAPDDYVIVGYDGVMDGKFHTPTLTSVGRSWKNLGKRSVEQLLCMIDGGEMPPFTFIESEPCYMESCGCTGTLDFKDNCQRLWKNLKDEERWSSIHTTARSILYSGSSMDDFGEKLAEALDKLEIEDAAVCVNELFTDKPDDDTNYLAISREGKQEFDIRKKITPTNLREKHESGIMVYASLHFGEKRFGYVVTPYLDKLFTRGRHRSMLELVYLALESIRQKIELEALNEKLNRLYVFDALTGLYNRNGYINEADKFFEKQNGRIYLVYCDMDGLKNLNDNYGHEWGDKGIQAAAKALRHGFADTDILVRMGGDEFLIIGSYQEEQEVYRRQKETELFLLQYGLDHDFPVDLRISMGYVFNEGLDTGRTLEELVREADNKMYNIKMHRRLMKQKELENHTEE